MQFGRTVDIDKHRLDGDVFPATAAADKPDTFQRPVEPADFRQFACLVVADLPAMATFHLEQRPVACCPANTIHRTSHVSRLRSQHVNKIGRYASPSQWWANDFVSALF